MSCGGKGKVSLRDLLLGRDRATTTKPQKMLNRILVLTVNGVDRRSVVMRKNSLKTVFVVMVQPMLMRVAVDYGLMVM